MAEPVPVDEDARIENELRDGGFLGHDWLRPVDTWAWICGRCLFCTHKDPTKHDMVQGHFPSKDSEYRELPKNCVVTKWNDVDVRRITGNPKSIKNDPRSHAAIYYSGVVAYRKERGLSAP